MKGDAIEYVTVRLYLSIFDVRSAFCGRMWINK